jgi:hypothetical protein
VYGFYDTCGVQGAPLQETLDEGGLFIFGPTVAPLSPTYACYTCTLSFITGPFIQSDSTGWSFAPGGFLALTGSVTTFDPITGPGSVLIPSTILFAGTFTGQSRLTFGGDFELPYSFSSGSFILAVNPALSNLLSLPGRLFYQGASGGLTETTGSPVAVPPYGAFAGSIDFMGLQAAPVPEPATVLLLVGGLITQIMLLSRKPRCNR